MTEPADREGVVTADLVESACELVEALDRVRVAKAAWRTYAGVLRRDRRAGHAVIVPSQDLPAGWTPPTASLGPEPTIAVDLANLVADRDHYMRANVVLCAAVERVKALHQSVSTARQDNGTPWCPADNEWWPCPTIRALEQP